MREANGAATPPAVALGFSASVAGTVADRDGEGTGFTSVLPNAAGTEYRPVELDLAGGRLTVTTTAGDAAANTQQNALRATFDGTAPYQVSATIHGPLALTQAAQGAGIFVGGGQDDHVKLMAGYGPSGPRLQLAKEQGGALTSAATAAAPALASAGAISLTLTVNPATKAVVGAYSIDGGPLQTLGTTTLPSLGTAADGAGIMATNAGGAPAIQVAYDAFVVEPAAAAGSVAFQAKDVIVSSAPGLQLPTSLALGPDGRLYAAMQNGKILVFDLDEDHDATHLRTITTIFDRPNHGFDGVTPKSVSGRQVTGIVFDPQLEDGKPVLYVSHSDPEIFKNVEPGQTAVDPASGTLTKLVLDASANVVSATDLVRGLPRSAENHGPNGMAFGPDGWLYLSLGGNTNFGRQSFFFGYFPETPLSASAVRVNPDAITAPIDASDGARFTWVDPCAAGETVGNGCSAAYRLQGSPSRNGTVPGKLELYATGFRNVYDLLWHGNGRLYANENEGNSGFGLSPGAGDEACTGAPVDPGTPPDELFAVQAGGYHGHPSPIRGECQLGGGVQPIATYAPNSSTTGIAEYTSTVFGGAMRGDILSTNYAVGDTLTRVTLAPGGGSVAQKQTLASNLSDPLDVLVHPDGTIFLAEHGGFPGKISVLRPIPSSPGAGCPPLGPLADADGDGYADQDELDNATGRCNPADAPPDADGDRISDRNDPDDDGDGAPDATDPLGLDATNGAGTRLPFRASFDASGGGGFFGSGFMGVQPSSKGGGALEGRVGAGGAGGFLQVKSTPGTAQGDANSQHNALQQGFVVDGPFTVEAAIGEPFQSGQPQGGEAGGIFLGPGEDDFVRLAVHANAGSPIVELGVEQGGTFTRHPSSPALPLPAASVRLFLDGDRAAGTVTARYRIGAGAIQTIATVPVPAAFLASPARAGVMTTMAGSPKADVPFVYEDFAVTGRAPAPTTAAMLTATHPGRTISTASSFTAGTFALTNTSTAGEAVTGFTIDLAAGPAMWPDVVFDPEDGTPAGDTVGKSFTVDTGTSSGVTATGAHAAPNGDGWSVLDVATAGIDPGDTLRFSIDIDPTSIRGVSGTPTPPAGGIGGAEMHGATLTVRFSDGSVRTTDISIAPGSLTDGRATASAAGPVAPSLARASGASPAAVSESAQTVVVSGPAGAAGVVVVAEGQMNVTDTPGGGFDLDPWEANTAVGITQVPFTIGPGGTVAVPITLTATADPSALEVGLNSVTAHLVSGGVPGPVSDPIVLKLNAPPPPPPPSGSGAVTFVSGQAVIEAEDFDAKVARSGDDWLAGQSPSGSVAGAMKVLPDNGSGASGDVVSTSPELAYDVQFPAAGTYYLWLRANGPDGAGNSAHVGLDGTLGTSYLNLYQYGAWTWVGSLFSGPRATVSVPSAGVHRVHVWMREDGLSLDRLLLTTSSSVTPTGNGPAATPRQSVTDTTAPTLSGRTPAAGATGVAPGANVVATFSEAMNPATLTAASFSLAPSAGGAAVPGAISASSANTVFTLDPSADLAPGTAYTATVGTAAKDAAGNALAATQAWSFTTAPAAPPDTTAPTLTGRQPAPGASGVAVSANAVATFSEAMNPATLTAASFSLAPSAGGAAVPAAISASSANTVFTLDPSANLAPGVAYTATLTTAAKDAAGNALASAQTWSFTTAAAPTSGTDTEITTGEILGAPFERRKFYVRTAGGAWQPTYMGGVATAAGKLMNFRAANAIFDDEARSDDDPAANTAEFISHFDEYRARGILAYTISLQGGFPGYEGAVASAFNADGSLRQAWLTRAGQVIEAADDHGQVVILTYFYQRQDQRLSGDEAVRAAVRNATDWLIAQGYRNVIVEIANEHDSALHDQPLIKNNLAVGGVAELISIAKSRFEGLGYRQPVSVSTRDLEFSGPMREAADLVLIHGNLTTPAQDGAATAALVADSSVHGPVVMNEDFNGFDATQANLTEDKQTATNVFNAGGSWGLMWQRYNQDYPFQWALGPSTDISGASRANYFRAILDHVGTLVASDTGAPTLTGRQPAPGASGVAVSANAVATFSEAMNPATLTATSFSLAPSAGGAAVPAAITASSANTVFTLDPSANLAPGVAYTATLTTAAKDAAGNALASAQTWSFTTAAAPPPGPGPVTFVGGQAVVEAEDFDQRIARAGDDWVPGAAPAGAVGQGVQAAPDNGTTVTDSVATGSPQLGFKLSFPAAGTYWLWARVNAPDGAGNSFFAGLDGTVGPSYMSTGTSASWVWLGGLFSGARATLSVPSAGEHTVQIWMREDGLRLDRILVSTTSGFTPTGTGPAATPREGGADTVAPTLNGRQPAPGATGVAVTANAVATFSEAMDPATLTGASFSLAPSAGGAAVGASIAASSGNTVFTLDPSADLAPGVAYTATVTTAAKDAAGNAIASAQTWSFTTAAAPPADTTAPTLTGRTPPAGATGVAPGADAVATFSEAMDPATLTGATFSLAPSAGGPAVTAGIAAAAGNTVFTLEPSADLAPGTQYTATVTTGAKDAAGNALAAPESWTFTTAAAPPPGAGAVTFVAGQAVVEAEDHDLKVARAGKDWLTGQSPAGSVAAALKALPDSGTRISNAIATTSPEIAYRVAFPAPGTYQLWLRMYGISQGNTLHVGLDGQVTAQNVSVQVGAWRWVKASIAVPSAGEHTVHAWMREDGISLDRLVLNTSGSAPSGTGPATTPRA